MKIQLYYKYKNNLLKNKILFEQNLNSIAEKSSKLYNGLQLFKLQLKF